MPTVDQLPYLDVESPAFNTDPMAAIRPVQAGSPVARSSRGVEVLSYAACRGALDQSDTTLDMSNLGRATGIHDGRAFQMLKESFVSTNGPDNRKIRKVLLPHFSPAKLAAFREGVRAKVRGLIERGIRDGVVDLAPIAQRIPASMFCSLAGAPDADWQRVNDVSTEALKVFAMDPAYRDEAEAGILAAEDYSRELIQAHREHPGQDDFVTGLVSAQDNGLLTDEEVVFTVSTMLQGAVDTTQSQLASMVALFAERPDQWNLLKEDPELIGKAVVEASRYRPMVWRFARWALPGGADVAGVEVPAGETIFFGVLAANHDPAVFGETADHFDVTADRPRQPLNWGLGIHFCPGRHLSVMEMEETLRVLVEDYGRLELVRPVETEGEPDVIRVREALVRCVPA